MRAGIHPLIQSITNENKHTTMEYPPAELSKDDESLLACEIRDWAYGNGFTMVASSSEADDASANAVPAPVTMHPTPFPRSAFSRALQVQQPFNGLYMNIVSQHEGWLLEHLGQLAKFDQDFTGRLLDIHHSVVEAGVTQHVQAGLFRSDYIVDETETDETNSKGQIKQVEFNTVSVSFGGLSTKASELHNFLIKSNRYGRGSDLPFNNNNNNNNKTDSVPVSPALQDLAKGLATMNEHYIRTSRHEVAESPCTAILFVVQPGERNALDQRLLEYELFNSYGLVSYRATLAEIHNVVEYVQVDADANGAGNSADQDDSQGAQSNMQDSSVYSKSNVNATSNLSSNTGSTLGSSDFSHVVDPIQDEYRQHLQCHHRHHKSSNNGTAPSKVKVLVHKPTKAEISVVYYRSGYGPNDYPSPTEWDGRLFLEESHAIKCPSVLTQLSGAKKVQQLLCDQKLVQSLLDDQDKLSPATLKTVMATMVGMYPLDDSKEGQKAKKLAFKEPHRFVLKPQREGGGNNIYKEDIPGFLKSIPEEQWQAYILMELINPREQQNRIVRNGEVYHGPIISELGVFGTVIWDNRDKVCLSNEVSGWLLRTKLQSSNEGGVAAGFGCIDSVCLV